MKLKFEILRNNSENSGDYICIDIQKYTLRIINLSYIKQNYHQVLQNLIFPKMFNQIDKPILILYNMLLDVLHKSIGI